MQKTICKKLYDTDAAELVKKVAVGSFGDAEGYEECLYRMPEGSYFLYVNGGADSKHPKEDITRLSAKKAEEWLAAQNA